LLYSYNPTTSVTLTVSKYSATNPANGAPTGMEISDVVDKTDGTSILYAYNPSSTVTETASFYSATNPTTGAPAGTLTSETIDYTPGQTYDSQSIGSSITTYDPNGTSSLQYYSGPDGTGSAVGSPIQSSASAAGQTTFASSSGIAGTGTAGPSGATVDSASATAADGTGSGSTALANTVATPAEGTSATSGPAVPSAGLSDAAPTMQFLSGTGGPTELVATAAAEVLSGGLGIGALSDAGHYGVTFLGTLADLANEALVGVSTKDTIDIADLNFPTASASFVPSAGGGVLQVDDGNHGGTIQLSGGIPDGLLSLRPDAGGGTVIGFG
jgi:hypothetical protein